MQWSRLISRNVITSVCVCVKLDLPHFFQTFLVIHPSVLVDGVGPQEEKGNEDKNDRPGHNQQTEGKINILRLFTGPALITTQPEMSYSLNTVPCLEVGKSRKTNAPKGISN